MNDMEMLMIGQVGETNLDFLEKRNNIKLSEIITKLNDAVLDEEYFYWKARMAQWFEEGGEATWRTIEDDIMEGYYGEEWGEV